MIDIIYLIYIYEIDFQLGNIICLIIFYTVFHSNKKKYSDYLSSHAITF